MPSPTLAISDEDRATLESWTRSRSLPAGHVERARIVLAVADGAGTSGTARLLDVSRPTVIKWRDRFAAYGIAGLDDVQRSGRPKVVDDSAIIAATLEPPPAKLGVTHWSSRLLGRHLGIGDATVARASPPGGCWSQHSPRASRTGRSRPPSLPIRTTPSWSSRT